MLLTTCTNKKMNVRAICLCFPSDQRQIRIVLVKATRKGSRRQQTNHASRHQFAGATPSGAHHAGQTE